MTEEGLVFMVLLSTVYSVMAAYWMIRDAKEKDE